MTWFSETIYLNHLQNCCWLQHNVAEISNVKLLATDTDEEDLEGSTEADTGELSRYKPRLIGATRQKGKKLEGRKNEIDNNYESHLDDIKEECSGTEEGQQLSAMRSKFDVEVNDTKISRSPMQRKKSKKVLFGRGVSNFYISSILSFKSLFVL